MSIPDHFSTNFDTLLRAASNGNLALMECIDAITGEPRYVICAVGREGTDYLFTPFGHLADGNPYDAYLPPAETLPGQIASLIPLLCVGVWTRRFACQRASRFRIAFGDA
jgi:Family of unknown function (DUF6117)